MKHMKWWEWVLAALYVGLIAWFVLAMLSFEDECAKRGGIMVYKTGCIKAERIVL